MFFECSFYSKIYDGSSWSFLDALELDYGRISRLLNVFSNVWGWPLFIGVLKTRDWLSLVTHVNLNELCLVLQETCDIIWLAKVS